MRSLWSACPLILIASGCTYHTETHVLMTRKTIPDSYVLQFHVDDELAKEGRSFMVYMPIPRDDHQIKLGSYLNEDRARMAHELYGSSLLDFNIELVDYRFDSDGSISGQLNITRQYPYRAHWSMPIGFTVGSTVKRILETPRQKAVTLVFTLHEGGLIPAQCTEASTAKG